VRLTNDIGKAPFVSIFAMIIYSNMSLHSFDSGSTCYSTIWSNNIENCRSQRNINNLVIIPNSLLQNDTDIIGTSPAGITSIVSSSINNRIFIHPFNGVNHNKASWALLSNPRALIQTMGLWKFRKKTSSSVLYMRNYILKNKTI
jgi:hypothetical protein